VQSKFTNLSESNQTESIKQQIKVKGISEDKIRAQLEAFRKGIPFIKLKRPCAVGDGIVRIDDEQIDELVKLHREAASEGRIIKFVPASGAATRMFKHLLAFNNLNEPLNWESLSEQIVNGDESAEYVHKFLKELKNFAFYDELKSVMSSKGLEINRLYTEGDLKTILEYLLTPKGLNYANLPKGLIAFHKYEGFTRTALEEHLVESAAFALDGNQTARIHLTVSIEHLESFKNHFEKVRQRYEINGITIDIAYSIQKESTDTIAVDMNNQPFILEDGRILFRPGGHGALLENLNDLAGDIIFIKNIDNVLPDYLKADTFLYKKILCGWLISLQNRLFQYLKQLESKQADEELIEEMLSFGAEYLSIIPPNSIDEYSINEKIAFLFSKFNRPIRVCGMVKNVGEPGGGPFWVEHKDGSFSLQIVEFTQINTKSAEQRRILNSSTHFNSVDIVCGVRNYRGENFNLLDFVDLEAGFITLKSKDGRKLKAMELPGLWNGGMAWWNTVFVETPITTFSPVKTANDLMKKEHQTGYY